MLNKSYFIERSCPCCFSGDSHADKVVTSPVRSENLSMENLEECWTGFFKEKSFFTYIQCPHCKLLYTQINFSPIELARLYANLPENMSTVPPNALAATQNGYFKRLQKWTKLLGGDYLEIGPDSGLFLTNCVQFQDYSKYWLFEPNENVIPALNNILQNQEKKIYADIGQIDEVPDSSVQTAVAVHVLDHLLDPLGSLKQLRKKMKATGHLLIVTHDETSILSKIFGWKWPAYCLQHPQLFNFKTTKTILLNAGFEVLEQAKTVNYFEIGFLLKHFFWAIGLRKIQIPDLAVFRVILPLKLGNIITIATPAKE